MICNEGFALKLPPGTYPQTPFLYKKVQLRIFHQIEMPKCYEPLAMFLGSTYYKSSGDTFSMTN